tara:strand:+ start:281 stop:751 length:471 start_codon:yes stop_codon:yes gene_type:complete
MQSKKYTKKRDNFPEHIQMEWDLIDIITSNLFSPYYTYNDDYYIEITSEEIKFLYNCHFLKNEIDYDSFYNMIDNIEDTEIDNNIYDYINEYYSIENIFDKKYGKNGVLSLFICREGIVMKDNKFDENDILWHIYPNKFLTGLFHSYEEDIRVYLS